jgi:B12-binding domain/radical SAM domain protein
MLRENKTDIRFISPNAFAYGSSDGKQINIEALEDLLKSIREVIGNKGRIFFGTFPSEVRPEFVIPEAVELVKRYCNNDNLVIGGQTGSERMLKFIHRGHSVEDIYKAVEITIKLGLKANVDFIFGLPGETEEDKIQTLRVIKDLTKMGARIHAHTFIPLVGTPFGDMKPGKIDEKTRKEIQRLISQGKLYGEWEKQERIAMATKRS